MDAVIESRVVEPRKSVPTRNRDRELVRYVGRLGLVRIEHVMKAMDTGRTVTYDRVAACVDAGLLERLEILRSEPGLLRATRDGLRYAGLGLPLARVSPGGVDHMLRCATTARLLERHYTDARVLSERELVLGEQIAGKSIASADVGERRGRVHLHRPDLAVITEGGVIAVEVELTPKAPRRLYELIRAWRFAIAKGTGQGGLLPLRAGPDAGGGGARRGQGPGREVHHDRQGGAAVRKSMPLPVEQVDADLIEAIARRVAELIAEPAPAELPELIDAAEVARRLGIHRGTVYRHPRRYGGEKISDGPKGRRRFDPTKIHGGDLQPASDGASNPLVGRRRRGRKAPPEGELKIRGTRP
jgi:hypothetical protein